MIWASRMLSGIAADSEDRFRGIIENALDVITLVDESGAIVYNSPAFSRQLGYTSEEVIGKTLFDFIHDDDRAYIEREFRKLISSMDVAGTELDFRFRHKDGRWRFFEAMVSNLLRNEKVHAIVLNSRDVTEQNESEEELEKYRSHLEELVEQRTQALTLAFEKERIVLEQQMTFISMVSHEFRTPLTIIDGNAQIIEKRGTTLDPEVLERRAKTIRTAVDRLVRLIEMILSSNMLESGKLVITRAPCDLIGIIRDVCIERLGISPSHKIKVDIQKGLPKMMLDEKVMHQIMVNLVSNAIKYSPNGGLVEVSAFQEDDTVTVKVADHGVGIPENELPKIFTRYFRASTSGGVHGSGLGLSLVKQFVELHDGTIGIESVVGEGTVVTVKLPLKTENKQGENAHGQDTIN